MFQRTATDRSGGTCQDNARACISIGISYCIRPASNVGDRGSQVPGQERREANASRITRRRATGHHWPRCCCALRSFGGQRVPDACWQNALDMAHVLAFFGSTSKPHPARAGTAHVPRIRKTLRLVCVKTQARSLPAATRGTIAGTAPRNAASTCKPEKTYCGSAARAQIPEHAQDRAIADARTSCTLKQFATYAHTSPAHRRDDDWGGATHSRHYGDETRSGGRSRVGLLKFFLFSSQPLPHSNKLLTLPKKGKV